MRTIPTDSADVAEQRELEEAQAESAAAEDREHVEKCRGGFLGEDAESRPRPCPRCRPHLLHAPCRTCGTPYATCNAQLSTRRGPCCDQHDHSRRTQPANTERTTA